MNNVLLWGYRFRSLDERGLRNGMELGGVSQGSIGI